MRANSFRPSEAAPDLRRDRAPEPADAAPQQRLWAAPGAPTSDLRSEAPAMQPLLDLVGRVANASAPILISGESGSGKEVVSRAIHARSARHHCRFVTVECPALLDSLSVPERPSTGKAPEAGPDLFDRIKAAEGGTLFLDEVGDLPLPWQAKLLRWVQDEYLPPPGQERPRAGDIRVIAATNRDLESDVRAGRFRSDLLFRLNTIELRVPALRDRPEDILPLATRFLDGFSRSSGRPTLKLSAAAEAALLAYPWPGNVRELRNVIERAVIVWRAPVVEPEAFPERVAGAKDGGPRIGGPFTLDQLERAHIVAILAHARTMDEAATTLGIDASTLWRKRRRFEGGAAAPR